jgi:glutathione S-transferase
MSQYELISFDLCPFVQRSVITLNKKNVQYNITYIDLKNKPEWFLDISPLGKVPVLKIDKDVLFESAVINEYLDEVTEEDSLPSDPLIKANYRAWIEFGSSLIMDHYLLSMEKTEQGYIEKLNKFKQKIEHLEKMLPGGEFFNGESFTLVDAAYAPLYTRILLCEKAYKVDFLSHTPKIKTWADAIVDQEYVKTSVKSDFDEKYLQYLKAGESYLSSLVR